MKRFIGIAAAVLMLSTSTISYAKSQLDLHLVEGIISVEDGIGVVIGNEDYVIPMGLVANQVLKVCLIGDTCKFAAMVQGPYRPYGVVVKAADVTKVPDGLHRNMHETPD
jgi:hypothetical protein